jgi:hypothetical protein
VHVQGWPLPLYLLKRKTNWHFEPM